MAPGTHIRVVVVGTHIRVVVAGTHIRVVAAGTRNPFEAVVDTHHTGTHIVVAAGEDMRRRRAQKWTTPPTEQDKP